jgi:hypothetical protein
VRQTPKVVTWRTIFSFSTPPADRLPYRYLAAALKTDEGESFNKVNLQALRFIYRAAESLIHMQRV